MGKTRNCRLTDEQKRIHRAAVEIRKKTDEQIFEMLESATESGRAEIAKEYKAVFDELLLPIFECVDFDFTGCPDDFRSCIKSVIGAGEIFADAAHERDGYFRNADVKAEFLEALKALPGIGPATIKRIEGVVHGK